MGDTPKTGGSEAYGEIEHQRLREQTDRMIDALTDPTYIEAVRVVRSAPDGERLTEATRQLSPDGLRRAGVPIPDGMRISSRYFEPGLPGEVELGDASPTGETVNVLNQVAPGLLDRLRVEQPELFARLAVEDEPMKKKPDNGDGTTLGLYHCACGGGTIPIPPFFPHSCGGAGANIPGPF
jgi:hypothetical protein